MFPLNLFEALGTGFLRFAQVVGQMTLLVAETFVWTFRRPFRIRAILEQMSEVGVNSIPVVLITSAFTGMVVALQTHTGFIRFGAESMIGGIVALSMTRELGPVLSGLIVTGRVGSSMAAELGTMKVTEQIDALYTMATNPVKHLVVPRVVACTLMMPILVIFADAVGMLGGYFVSVVLLDINPHLYVEKTFELLEMNDVVSGLVKSVVFGNIMAVVGCYEGFYTEGGAEGVGKATTRAVVIASISILINDYFLTALLFGRDIV